jgi:hypothetical protein
MNSPSPASQSQSATRTAAQGGHVLHAAAYLGVIACVLLLNVTGNPVFRLPLSLLSIIAITLSIPRAARLARVISLGFVGSGSLLLWQAGLGLEEWLRAFGDMAYLLALFAALPVLAEPIRLGGYSHAIQALLQRRVSGLVGLNCLTTLMAYLCGSVVSLAAVPIMMACLQPVVERYPLDNRLRFMTGASISGYVLPLFWTPVSGVVGVVLHTLRLDWAALFPRLFALSAGCLLINWLIFYLLEARKPAPPAAPPCSVPAEVPSPWRGLGAMLVGIALLVAAFVLIEYRLGVGLVTVVTLVAVPGAFLWCAAIGQGRRFVTEGGRAALSRIPRMADQFAVFLAAGFFAAAIRLSGADAGVNQLFMQLSAAVGAQALALLIPVMTLAASFLGLHPLVAIALLADSLRPELLGLTSAQLALALIGGSVLTFMLGPFSGTLGLTQTISGVSAFRLCAWNAPYAFGYFLLLATFLLK